jgi:hypothetical protein
MFQQKMANNSKVRNASARFDMNWRLGARTQPDHRPRGDVGHVERTEEEWTLFRRPLPPMP